MTDTATIERLAREAGAATTDGRGRVTFEFDSYGLARFAALIEAQMKEQCATVCEGVAEVSSCSGIGVKRAAAISAANSCAAAIRAL